MDETKFYSMLGGDDTRIEKLAPETDSSTEPPSIQKPMTHQKATLAGANPDLPDPLFKLMGNVPVSNFEKGHENEEQEINSDVKCDSNNGGLDKDSGLKTAQNKKLLIDRFFTDFAGAAPSPIKPKSNLALNDDSESQGTLDLRLDKTYSAGRPSVSSCVQPDITPTSPLPSMNNLEMQFCDDQQKSDESPVASEANNNIDAQKPSKDDAEDLDMAAQLHRKRSQDKMEPAAFELPRATKQPHKDLGHVPEFQETSAPLIDFGAPTDVVFLPKLQLNGCSVQSDSSIEAMSVQEISGLANVTFDKPQTNDNPASQPLLVDTEVAKTKITDSVDSSNKNVSQSSDAEKVLTNVSGDQMPSKIFNKANAQPGKVATEIESNSDDGNVGEQNMMNATFAANTTRFLHDATLDMTVRVSGGTAFALGVLLALDEALDPLVSPLIPFGNCHRRRGANLVFVVGSVILAILAWFILF